MASIWKGAITFGLVNVPVELHPSVRESRLSFRMLHGKDETPIQYKRVRKDTGDEVPWDEIVKGYEISKGDFVVLSSEDFTKAAVEKSDTLDVTDFVDADAIDPRFYEGTYYLIPGKGGARAYALLRDALAKTETVGVGRIIVRQRQHVAAVRASGDAMLLMLMRFPEELVDESEYEFPAHTPDGSAELTMAVDLVTNLRGEFDASKYVDEYDANLRKLISARSKGRRVTLKAAPGEKRDPKVVDLMERLQKSLAASKSASKSASRSTSGARSKKRKTA